MSPRNRRQSSNQNASFSLRLPKIKLEYVLSIVSIVITGIALFFAWQANRLTQEANSLMFKQVSDQLAITKIIHISASEFAAEGEPTPNIDNPVIEGGAPPKYLFCSHKIRLSNLGESATSLVNFSVRASYKDEMAFLEGFGEAITFAKDSNSIQSLPIKDIQSILISEEMLKTKALDQQWLNNPDNGIDLPISVLGKSSLDFIVHTILVMDEANPLFEGKKVAILYRFTTSTSEDTPDLDNNKIMGSFKMMYIFETAVGQIISTDPLTCWQIGFFPAGTNIHFQNEP